VRDHLSSAKDYPKKGGTAKSPKVPSGVILDCTYLVRNDYERMWAWMIIHLPAEDLRTPRRRDQRRVRRRRSQG
jgi:hypothetical protein